jgi:vitamin B12 transporter
MNTHLTTCQVALFAVALATDLPASAENDRMETLVVRAAREPVALEGNGSAVTVLSRELLANRQAVSLSELLRSVPGVAVSRSGVTGSQTQVRMRGGESNHVLVFIDGVRANDPAQNGEFNFAHMLNTELESVEIIRGPQSALWGSDALSGVINITTRRAGSGLAARAFAEGGSNSWQHGGASGSYGGEEFTAAFSASYLDTDGENISRSGNEDDGYENTTANGNVAAQLTDSFGLEASLRYVDSNNEFDGVDFSTGLPADSRDETDTEQFYGRIAGMLDTLEGRWRLSAAFSLTDTDNENLTENAFAPTGFDLFTTRAEVGVLTLQTSFDLAPGHTLTGAWEHIDEDFKQRGPVVFGDPNRDEDMDTDAFIAEYRADLGQQLHLQASVRHDDNSDFDDKTTGRLTAALQLRDGAITLRGGWGTGIKNPTFTERFGFFTDFVGNPDLKPEESEGWELGIDAWLPGERLQLAATWFDEELEDEINGFVFDPTSGGFTAANEDGKSQREGLELSGHWQISTGLALYAAYTWLDATEDSDNGQVDEVRRSEHVASANLNWDLLSGRANLNLNVDYNGEQDDLYFPPVPPFQERVELDDFTLVSLAGHYMLWDRLQLFARVENALDEDYEEVFGYRAPGRSVFAGLRYNFVN